MTILLEYLSPERAQTDILYEDTGNGKNLYMKGICIQGGVRNANQRVYPVNEIKTAIEAMNRQIKEHGGILGEADHPANLKINLDRVSHMITEMWQDGPNGFGKLKILPTPMGQLVKTMLESGVKLGVSSRGSGDVNESDGQVRNFEIVTVDVVAQPSAPGAYPQAIYESLMNMRGGTELFEMASEVRENPKVQRHLAESITRFINELKL